MSLNAVEATDEYQGELTPQSIFQRVGHLHPNYLNQDENFHIYKFMTVMMMNDAGTKQKKTGFISPL